ncbi:hypothetical protein J6590_094595 [Homalodisca vitripennis]|nr:hypothetical protein J6590_094595 [Homalodisca vitripennis]
MWAERTVPRAYLHEESEQFRVSLHEQSEQFRERLYTSRVNSSEGVSTRAGGKTRTLSSVNFMLYWTTNSGWVKSKVFYECVAYLFNNFLGKITNSVPELWGIGPPTPDG